MVNKETNYIVGPKKEYDKQCSEEFDMYDVDSDFWDY